MHRRARILLPAALLLAGILLYLLFPLSSREFRIDIDDKKLRYKKHFLEQAGLRRDDPPDPVQKDGVPPSGVPPSGAKPNIVLLLADDLGKTDISLYGNQVMETPHIDAIGRGGVTFTEAYCTASICAPSRASLLTGRYAQRFGFELQPHDHYPRNRLETLLYRYLLRHELWEVSENKRYPRPQDIRRQGLPASEITLAELLRADGYRTGILGKWHLGYEEPFRPHNHGFEIQYGFYEAFSLYAPIDDPDIVNQRHNHFANRHIWSRGRDGSCAIRRNDEIIDEKEYLTTRLAEEAVQFLRQHREEPFFLYVPFSAPHTPFQATRKHFDQLTHIEDQNQRVYYAMIKALDEAVGTITGEIRRLGLEEETIIVFASDNGGATYTGATQNAPLKGGKFSDFEGGLNIPFMLRWKDRITPTEYLHPVSLMDIFTTIAGAAGLPLPSDRVYDGIDLLPHLDERKGQPQRALFWRSDYNKAIRSGDWKLILNERDDRTLLYNLNRDKTEGRNRAGTEQAIRNRLQTELENWEKALKAPLWPKVMHYRFMINGVRYSFAI